MSQMISICLLTVPIISNIGCDCPGYVWAHMLSQKDGFLHTYSWLTCWYLSQHLLHLLHQSSVIHPSPIPWSLTRYSHRLVTSSQNSVFLPEIENCSLSNLSPFSWQSLLFWAGPSLTAFLAFVLCLHWVMSKTELLCLFLLDIVIAFLLFSPVISHHMTRAIRATTGYFGCQFNVVLYPNNLAQEQSEHEWLKKGQCPLAFLESLCSCLSVRSHFYRRKMKD